MAEVAPGTLTLLCMYTVTTLWGRWRRKRHDSNEDKARARKDIGID